MDLKCCSVFYFMVSTFAIPMLLVVGWFLYDKDQKYIGEIKEEDANSAASGCFIAAGVYGICCVAAAIGYCQAERNERKRAIVNAYE